MKTYINYFIAFIVGVSLLASCTSQDETAPVTKGEADFSNYVAFGNSLTAGYADNALYYEGQISAYPNLLAKQMEQVGGGEFRQPLIEDKSSVGIGSDGNAKLVLDAVDGDLSPVPAAGSGDFSIFQTSVADQGPFNNMGVPGATALTAVFPGYGNPANGDGNYNPFFTRMTADPQNASMLDEAVAQDPTFFTVFIGNNDVLAYATSGGTGSAITPMDGVVGQGFSSTYDAIVGAFLQTGAKGALANIPDVTSTPFFTTIPYNALVLKAEEAEQLNGALKQKLGPNYDPLVAAGVVPEFEEGPSGFLIADGSSPVGFRQIQKGELVLLPAQVGIQTQGWGTQTPIPDEYVLTADELEKIKTATEEYNEKIRSVAEQNDLAFVDVNAFLKKIDEEGVNLNGREISTEFVTGGAFSLDGIHLTPLGNVLLANEFIDAINSTYEAYLPHVDPTNYGGVKFP